jgi:3-oxoadipate enol-lactonase
MQVKANGNTFNVEIDGAEGKPWLVFSNSLATNLSMWDEQVARLKGKFRILRYDQRGHGKSEAPGGRYTFDMLVADAIGLFDALSIDRAHFAGISMGGMTALGLAEQHPQRVRSIIPCDCSANSTPASAQQWEERIKVAREQGMEGLVESTVARWFPGDALASKPALAAKVRGMIRATPVSGFIGCSGALAGFDFRPGLGKIACPTLVVVGTKDAMLAGSREAQASIPGSRLVEIPDAGHLSNLDDPDAYTRALEDFLGTAASA